MKKCLHLKQSGNGTVFRVLTSAIVFYHRNVIGYG
jgi:hypothetical protein